MTRYYMPFNKVPYTSDFRRYMADIFLHSQKFHLFRIGEKNFFVQRPRIFIYANDIMPQFILQEAETWQNVVFVWGWKGGREKQD